MTLIANSNSGVSYQPITASGFFSMLQITFSCSLASLVAFG